MTFSTTTAALEIPEGLKQRDRDPEIGAHLFDFPRAAVVVEKVILENLHPVETGGGNGFKFFRQGTAQGHGGNGTLHISTPGGGDNLVIDIARFVQEHGLSVMAILRAPSPASRAPSGTAFNLGGLLAGGIDTAI